MTVPAGPGGLPAFAANWLPSPAEVRAELPARAAIFSMADTLWDDVAIQAVISGRGGSLNTELPQPLPSRFWQCAHDYVLYSSAAALERRLSPEQAAENDSNAASFDRDAGAELSRLRTQLGEDAAGDPPLFSGSVSMSTPSLRRARAIRRGYGLGFGRRPW